MPMYPEPDANCAVYPYRVRGWLLALIVTSAPATAYVFYIDSFYATFEGFNGRGGGIIQLFAEAIHLVLKTDLEASTHLALLFVAMSFVLFTLWTLAEELCATLAGRALIVGPASISLVQCLWRGDEAHTYPEIETVTVTRSRYFRTLRLHLKGGGMWDLHSRFLPSAEAFDAVHAAVDAHVARGNSQHDAGSFATPQQA
jgi:hypothetical protein